MNYNHLYHAGNFADVFKHSILIALIEQLTKKENAFCFMDTHAGAGLYHFFSKASQIKKEYESGIRKVFHQSEPPALIKNYLQCVQTINDRVTQSSLSSVRYYPGSPLIARAFLRKQDRMIFSELHPKECALLKKHFVDTPSASVHVLDGYQGLKAFLPPKERRGLILIDPPYEKQNELAHIVTMLSMALKRFATGTYAIWYPIKDRASIDYFHRLLKENISHPTLLAELNLYPEASAQHLNGCGMIIINPPWQLDQSIHSFLPWLSETLSPQGKGHYSLKELV